MAVRAQQGSTGVPSVAAPGSTILERKQLEREKERKKEREESGAPRRPTWPCGYSRPKLAYSLRRSSRVSSVPMLLSVMLSARRSACGRGWGVAQLQGSSAAGAEGWGATCWGLRAAQRTAARPRSRCKRRSKPVETEGRASKPHLAGRQLAHHLVAGATSLWRHKPQTKGDPKCNRHRRTSKDSSSPITSPVVPPTRCTKAEKSSR